MIDEYTRLLESAAEHEDARTAHAAVDKLIAHLMSTGRVKMLPQIAKALKRIVARRRALQPYVEVAHAADSKHALAAAAAYGIVAEEARINPSLVRGWRARAGTKIVDRSGKQALIDIYKKVTA